MPAKRNKKKRKLSARERRERKLFFRIFFIFLLFFIIFVSFIYIIHLPQMRIENYDIQGIESIEKNQVESVIDLYFDEHALFFPKDSFMFYNKTGLEERLMQSFPRLDSVTVEVSDFNLLKVDLLEKNAKYYVKGNNQVLLSDENGYIFAYATSTKGRRLFSSALKEDNITIRGNIMSRGGFKKFNNFLDKLEKLGIHVSKIYLSNEIETILELDNGTSLIIHPRDSYERILEVLREILPYAEFSYDFKKGIFSKNVDYINLRHGNKILYCYKSDKCAGNYEIK